MHLQDNLVVVTPDPERELRLEELPRAIRRAGFVPAEMRLRARGAYVLEDGELAFRIHAWPRLLAVRTEQIVPPGETLLHARVDYSGRELVLEPFAAEARMQRDPPTPPSDMGARDPGRLYCVGATRCVALGCRSARPCWPASEAGLGRDELLEGLARERIDFQLWSDAPLSSYPILGAAWPLLVAPARR